MPTVTSPNRRISLVRLAVVSLAVAATGYVAGALSNKALLPDDDPPAFFSSVSAGEYDPRDPLPALATVPPAAVDWSRYDGERIAQPRECDVMQGISSACVFMD
jgi:hypothetical protein